MELQQHSRTLELPLSESSGAGSLGLRSHSDHATREAVRAAAQAPGDLDTRTGEEPGTAARLCPLCGQSPDPRRVPQRVPRWLRRAWLRSLAPAFTYGPGWAL